MSEARNPDRIRAIGETARLQMDASLEAARLAGLAGDRGAALHYKMRILELAGLNPLNNHGLRESTPEKIRALLQSIPLSQQEALAGKISQETIQNRILLQVYMDFVQKPEITTPIALATRIIQEYELSLSVEQVLVAWREHASSTNQPTINEIIIEAVVSFSQNHNPPLITYDQTRAKLIASGHRQVIGWIEQTGQSGHLILKLDTNTSQAAPLKKELPSHANITSALLDYFATHQANTVRSLLPAFMFVRSRFSNVPWGLFTTVLGLCEKTNTLPQIPQLRAHFDSLTNSLIATHGDVLRKELGQGRFIFDTTISIIALANANIDFPTLRWYVSASDSSNLQLIKRIARLADRAYIPNTYLESARAEIAAIG